MTISDTPLFDEASFLSRPTDPDTSQAAAASQVKNLSKLQAIVLEVFEDRLGGFADHELTRFYEEHWELNGWPAVRYETPRKRRSDLSRDGYLIDSGQRRNNGFGSDEVVWVRSSKVVPS